MKLIKRLILILIIIVIVVGTIFILNGKKMYEDTLSEKSLEDTVEEIRKSKNFVDFNSLPDDYINAVIAVEDHRYREHGAVDFIAIGRAIWTNVTHLQLREGGSTITQQVAKNLFFISEDDAATRKVAEIFAAIDLEKKYSKNDILELYVNTIYFGDGYYGIKQACKRLFRYFPFRNDFI